MVARGSQEVKKCVAHTFWGLDSRSYVAKNSRGPVVLAEKAMGHRLFDN
jgi:hypothetical protein